MKKLLLLTLCVLTLALPALADTAEGYRLKLNGNPTTGYDWSYTLDQEGIVEVTGEYVAPDSGMVGAPGYYDYLVIGKAEGDVTLTLAYSRSFEENSEIVTLSYTFHVDQSMNVVCLGSEVSPI